MSEEKRLTKEWEVSAFDRVNNEWTTTMNHAYEHAEDFDPELLVRQSPPIRVTPTRRVRPESNYITVVGYGDTHHPYQNDRRLDLAENVLKELQPDHVVMLGDDLDNPMQGTYERKEQWAGDTQRGIDQLSERMGRIRALIGHSTIVSMIEGNHDIRVERDVRRTNAELLGIKRASESLGVLTIEFLLRCEELGIDYYKGYPSAELWIGDKLKVYHGRLTGRDVVGRELKSENTNFMHGHGHSGAKEQRTFREGRNLRTITGMQVGAFACQLLTPSGQHATDRSGNALMQAQNWNSNLGVWFVPKDGDEEPVGYLINVNDEHIDIFGKKYRS